MDVENRFNERKESPLWNTSYPLSPSDWTQYRTYAPLDFNEETELSFYVHIPFCKQICSFCEYSRMLCPNETEQREYIDKIGKDVRSFIERHKEFTLRGFDIGGGTPTALSEENLTFLMTIFSEAIGMLNVSEDFEPSIEGTFGTLSENKIRSAVSAGIKRLSLGVQSTDKEVLGCHHRQGPDIQLMESWMNTARKLGIEKINLDLMYGLQMQNEHTIKEDLKAIERLRPEHVTLYELRTNMISLKDVPSKEALYSQYSALFSGLIKLGYNGRFGQNTFSVTKGDFGVSSYIRSRMLEGVPYKGFGVSAQSMCNAGVSYNVGKATGTLTLAMKASSFQEEYTYNLPPGQLASKYIAIAAYNGSFSLTRVSDLLKADAFEYFKNEISFCISEGLMSLEKDRLFITPEGFKYYGAVFSLFYSK